MRLTDSIHLVGSGGAGFDLTHPCDCHVFLVDGSDAWALVDAGSGMDSAAIVANIEATGVDTAKPGYLLVTHGHADHSGGVADLVERFPTLQAFAHPTVSQWLREGDEKAISLDMGIASGIYPPDYRLRIPKAIGAIEPGATVVLGNVELRAINSPGHCAGHLCWIMDNGQQRILFSGDCLFFDGKVSVQNLHDVSIGDYAATLSALNDEDFDVFLPGHGSISLSRGKRHIEMANKIFTSGLVPTSIV